MAIEKKWREPGKKTFSIVIGGDFCPREENSRYAAEHAAGVGYLGTVSSTGESVWPPADWNDKATHDRWITVRDLFTCESHSYLLNNTCRLIEEFRMDEAKAGYDRIGKMQASDFVTW